MMMMCALVLLLAVLLLNGLTAKHLLIQTVDEGPQSDVETDPDNYLDAADGGDNDYLDPYSGNPRGFPILLNDRGSRTPTRG